MGVLMNFERYVAEIKGQVSPSVSVSERTMLVRLPDGVLTRIDGFELAPHPQTGEPSIILTLEPQAAEDYKLARLLVEHGLTGWSHEDLAAAKSLIGWKDDEEELCGKPAATSREYEVALCALAAGHKGECAPAPADR